MWTIWVTHGCSEQSRVVECAHMLLHGHAGDNDCSRHTTNRHCWLHGGSWSLVWHISGTTNPPRSVLRRQASSEQTDFRTASSPADEAVQYHTAPAATASRPAHPTSCLCVISDDSLRQWTTWRMSAVSTTMPNAVVDTTTRIVESCFLEFCHCCLLPFVW